MAARASPAGNGVTNRDYRATPGTVPSRR
jgi:hypothetical protein